MVHVFQLFSVSLEVCLLSPFSPFIRIHISIQQDSCCCRNGQLEGGLRRGRCGELNSHADPEGWLENSYEHKRVDKGLHLNADDE